MALKGVDPRRFDLNQLLAAFEATLKQGAKDEAEWVRTRSKLYAEPREVKKERLAEAKAGRGAAPARNAMSLEGVEALLAGVAARDARLGAS